MIRCKITPRFTGATVRIDIEWVEVVDEQIVRTVASEEFAIAPNRDGCAYVTRGGFDAGHMLSGTFWIDETGHRHFVMQAEAGRIGLTGKNTAEIANGNNILPDQPNVQVRP